MGKEREIEWGIGGLVNPFGHLKCGAKDERAKIPEPAHISCPRCHSALRKLLAARAIDPPNEPDPQQTSFDF